MTSAGLAIAQTQPAAPAFPKYKVMAVVYAPPGSASSVTYGNSNLVGSTDTMSTTNSSSNTVSTSISAGGGIGPLSVEATYKFSDEWSTSSEYSDSIAVQTTTGNSISTMGPISSSLGVDHDNDIIYIWLNPVLTGSSSGSVLNWTGLASNTCDPNNPMSLTIDQAVNGCDPNQYPYPDVVGIPVWCLKNPHSPVQGCAQWLEYTSRSWDRTIWPVDPTGLSTGPGLTMRDYADILQADPFVVVNGTEVDVCHPTYGPSIDPNLEETVNNSPLAPNSGSNGSVYTVTQKGISSSRINYADPYDPNYSNTSTSTGFYPLSCNGQSSSSSGSSSVYRFQPYGAVEYPVPGPNGLPSTYSGTFQYSDTQTVSTVVTDTHTISQGISVCVGSLGACNDSTNSGGAFNASATVGYDHTTTWQQQSSNANTQGTTSSAAYSITGPQLSDNYTGPATYNVYLDNVYGTYAFYSDLTPPISPSQLGTVGIKVGTTACTANTTSKCGSVATPVQIQTAAQWTSQWSSSGYTSANELQVTLTNNSAYQMTMAWPAVTFSDPAFQIVPGTDSCSNSVLAAAAQCTLSIVFAPVPSDMPNPIYSTNVTVVSNIIAAGTVNASPYQNILVTDYGLISGVASPAVSQSGATLLPANPNTNTANAYVFQFSTSSGYYDYFTTGQSEQFTFTNMSSSQVIIGASPNGVALTDSADFSVASDNCSGRTMGAYGSGSNTCTITLVFNPTTIAASGEFATGISVNGVTTSGSVPVQPVAGATAYAVTNPISVSPVPASFSYTQVQTSTFPVIIPYNADNYSNLYNYGWAVPITITNNTGVGLTFAANTTPIYIDDSRGGQYTCEADAGSSYYGDEYFSPCIYQTSTATTTPENGDSVVTTTSLPAPFGYVFGQLSGAVGGYIGSPWYYGPMANTSQDSAHAYTSYYGSGSGWFYDWGVPSLNCSGTLAAYSSCTAAVVMYLPGAPDDQSWNGVYFNNFNSAVWLAPNTFGSNFTLPISGTFATRGGNIASGITFPVTVVGAVQNTNTIGATTQVKIVGSETSNKVTVSAAPATGSLVFSTASASPMSRSAAPGNVGHVVAPAERTPLRLLPANPVISHSTIAVGVGSFSRVVNIPAGTSLGDAVSIVASQLNVSGSPVSAIVSGTAIKLTSVKLGKASNVPLSVFALGDFSVAASGNSLAGGTDAGTTTQYDSGNVQLSTYGATVSVPWDSSSTPQSIAAALANSINTSLAPYWRAYANGDTVTMTDIASPTTDIATSATSGAARNADAKAETRVKPSVSGRPETSSTSSDSSASKVAVSVTDSAGFASPSFGVATE
jgi:hypothetical protein